MDQVVHTLRINKDMINLFFCWAWTLTVSTLITFAGPLLAVKYVARIYYISSLALSFPCLFFFSLRTDMAHLDRWLHLQ